MSDPRVGVGAWCTPDSVPRGSWVLTVGDGPERGRSRRLTGEGPAEEDFWDRRRGGGRGRTLRDKSVGIVSAGTICVRRHPPRHDTDRRAPSRKDSVGWVGSGGGGRKVGYQDDPIAPSTRPVDATLRTLRKRSYPWPTGDDGRDPRTWTSPSTTHPTPGPTSDRSRRPCRQQPPEPLSE